MPTLPEYDHCPASTVIDHPNVGRVVHRCFLPSGHDGDEHEGRHVGRWTQKLVGDEQCSHCHPERTKV